MLRSVLFLVACAGFQVSTAEEVIIRKISNPRKVFSAIHKFDTLVFPSEDIKTIAGKEAWGDWIPVLGMEGKVVHSWGLNPPLKKHLLQVGERYVVIGEDGLEGDPWEQQGVAHVTNDEDDDEVGGDEEGAKESESGDTLASDELVLSFLQLDKGQNGMWWEYIGFLAASDDIHVAEMRVSEAFAWCNANVTCSSFTFDESMLHNDGGERKHIWFKDDSAEAPFAGIDTQNLSCCIGR
jgi:hypothetical protein